MTPTSTNPATTSSSGEVVLDDGLTIPAKIQGMWITNAIDGLEVDLTAEYDSEAGRYIASEVVVRAAGQEVTSQIMRSIPVAALLRHAVTNAIGAVDLVPQLPDSAEVLQPGPSVATLRHVARVYRLALLLGDPPTARVAESLEVPRSTAGRWVTRARDRGYLTVTDPRATRTR
ncbi:hypothetical protein AB0C04_10175 [Micromonospora sp. NPDC048909]|uniref:hypothetical protein n=1 Tax=Micromonospora sp. NPDC048909 TaxID=3155643 RepID=UPI0033F0047F